MKNILVSALIILFLHVNILPALADEDVSHKAAGSHATGPFRISAESLIWWMKNSPAPPQSQFRFPIV